MIPNASGKPESIADDREQLTKLLDLELAQKRAAWKQARARYRTIRSMGFVFLFLLIIGTVFALFFVFSRVNEERTNQHNSPNAAVSGR
jgi:hypothetical protein